MFKLKQLLAALIVILTLVSVNQWSKFPLGNTFTNWAINAAVLGIAFGFAGRKDFPLNTQQLRWFIYFMGWVAICCFRGIFIPENYWDWKNYVTGFFILCLPWIMTLFLNPLLLQYILRIWMRWALPLFCWVLIFNSPDSYGFYLHPLLLFIIFLPSLTLKQKLLIMVPVVIMLVADLDARSNIIKFGAAILITFLYRMPIIRSAYTMRILRSVFLYSPFLLITLAIFWQFNIFQLDKNFGGGFQTTKVINGETVEVNLTADTRTFIYVEVIESALENNYVLFGRTPARGNDSEAFGEHMALELGVGRYERYNNEVGITDIFTWTGLLGVFLYFLVFFRATWLALYKSSNRYVQVLGVYLAFQWAYSWVENFTGFNIQNITLWMMMAICYSVQFRQMTDAQFKQWMRDIIVIRKPSLMKQRAIISNSKSIPIKTKI